MFNSDLSLPEILGLNRDAAKQTWFALRGDAHVPPSRAGLSSLRQFTPRLALATWRGQQAIPRRAVIINLVNHTPTPFERGWSVRVTQVRDFRGRGLTYDSHNGTDFAVPPASLVLAAAPGVVVSVRSEYNRGGTKVAIDHGGGLATSSHHLARALVAPGARVARGQPIGLSGYSGVDALASLGMVAPHVHFNVLLGGRLSDPFAPLSGEAGSASLWRGAEPLPNTTAAPEDSAFAPTAFDAARVEAAFTALRDPRRREEIRSIADPHLRAWELVLECVTYPLRFEHPDASAALFDRPARREALDLPFSSRDFDGAVFADEVGYKRS